jgi:BirA family biotin operon repressor/biotin-[acetyl-CoA-carboxylase] ligase
MNIRDGVIRCLADGRIHSGTSLAARLGVSRSAVWKHIRQFGALGLEVQSAAGRGYQLSRKLELFDRQRLLDLLSPLSAAAVESLDIYTIADSTSGRLLRAPRPMLGTTRVCFAEFQTDGRGRRGRRWFSPYGSGICMSMSWCFDAAPRDLPALSLVAGLAVRRALERVGARGVFLKWPNDVVCDGRKLAGVLVDVAGESGGPLTAVIGIGVNVAVSTSLAARVAKDSGLPPGGLDATVLAQPVSRHRAAAELLDSLFSVLVEFSQHGFAPFVDEWRQCDWLFGRQVDVQTIAERFAGTAAGIAADGALLLDRRGQIATVLAGDVTVRQTP